MDNLFEKIISKEIPAQIIYQDEFVTAFNDIAPQAPVHILIVPNKNIPTVNDAQPEDEFVLGKLFTTAKKLAIDLNIAKSGYRLIVNCNQDAGQIVYHIHMHLLGGKPLGPLISTKE